jgi:riboflavin synthase
MINDQMPVTAVPGIATLAMAENHIKTSSGCNVMTALAVGQGGC